MDRQYQRTSKILIILSILFLILCVGLFYYAMSQVTEIGVGSFIGNGDVSTTLPGETEGILINSSWGPGLGFYLAVLSLIFIVFSSIRKKK